MKTKLLKRVRSRFTITHLPTGYIDNDGDRWDYNIFRLDDAKNDFNTEYAQLGRKNTDINKRDFAPVFYNEKDCIDYLLFIVIQKLRRNWPKSTKAKNLKLKEIKVWYVNK